MRRLLLSAAAGLVFAFSNVSAGETMATGFPILGGEYLIGAPKKVLPACACDDGHIVFLEHGSGSWYRVAFNVPAPFSWNPAQVGEVWINLDHVVSLEPIPEDGRLIRVGLGP